MPATHTELEENQWELRDAGREERRIGEVVEPKRAVHGRWAVWALRTLLRHPNQRSRTLQEWAQLCAHRRAGAGRATGCDEHARPERDWAVKAAALKCER